MFFPFEKSIKINMGKGVAPNLGIDRIKGVFFWGFPNLSQFDQYSLTTLTKCTN